MLALGGSELGAFLRVDTHRDDAKVLAGLPVDGAQGVDERVEFERAQHRALVVVEREDDRALPIEILAERDGLTVVVDEAQGRVHRLAQVFLDSHSFELPR